VFYGEVILQMDAAAVATRLNRSASETSIGIHVPDPAELVNLVVAKLKSKKNEKNKKTQQMYNALLMHF